MQNPQIKRSSPLTQKIIDIDSASEAPEKDKAEYFLEPMAICLLVAPNEYAKELKLLCDSRRGAFI
jgi:translation elongation factor EF-4